MHVLVTIVVYYNTILYEKMMRTTGVMMKPHIKGFCHAINMHGSYST